MPKDFFVSYNKADRTWAEWIAWELEEAGYTTVIQAWDFRPGGNFVLDMQQAAAGTRRTLAVLSPDYLTSLFTQPEWAAAFRQDPTGAQGILLPVRVRDCALEGLLGSIIYIDLVDLTEEAVRETLLEGVKRERVKPSIRPGFPGTGERSVPRQPEFPGFGGVPSVSSVAVGDVGRDLSGKIAGRDIIDVVIQNVQQTGLPIPHARSLPAQLTALQQALPSLDAVNKTAAQAAIEKLQQAIADLPTHEQSYRKRIRQAYAKQSAKFVELISKTDVVEASLAGAGPDEVDLLEFDPDDFEMADEVPDDLPRSDLHEWRLEGQQIKRVKLNSLREGIDTYPCIILLGEPGCGKTTALEYLAFQFAEAEANGSSQLPLPLRLSEFNPGMSVEELIITSWRGSLKANHWQAPELVANLEGYLEAGRLLILFDALNEMPTKEYQQRAQALRDFIDRWSGKGNRFLVTCRVLDYDKELDGLQRVEVQPFNDEQIEIFLRKVLGKHWSRMWDILTGGSDKVHRLLEMARNPYVLRMMVTEFIRRKGRLSQNRARLMEGFTEYLWQRARRNYRPEEWLPVEVQREALAEMAFGMQTGSGSGAAVPTHHVKKVIPTEVQTDPAYPPDPIPSPDQVLNLAASANIIEMPVDRTSVRFYHQLLQEYFAAHRMLKQKPESLAERWRWQWLETETPLWQRPEDNYDPLPPPKATGWEETTVLAAGLAPENDDQLVRALIQVNPVLAGRCLYEGQAKVDKASRQAVIGALLGTIAKPEVALRVRIAAGEVLGYLGDPRLGEMVTVPAGKFLMGTRKEEIAVLMERFGGERTWYEEETPQHELYLPEYQIGQYPVTNAEYGRFIEAEGYQDKRWWTEAGWEQKERDNWTEPRYWRDTSFNKPNQPVVTVSWYECTAYCRWLSAETGRQYRLPTEAEWEKVARGVDGREFPWGKKFEASRLNAREGEQVVWTTTPVGIYPTGVSPFGAFDCAGNVWEWCATEWEKPYPYGAEEDEWQPGYLERTNVLRVLRGGSWLNYRLFARCSFRLNPHPHLRDNIILGFGWCSPPSGLLNSEFLGF